MPLSTIKCLQVNFILWNLAVAAHDVKSNQIRDQQRHHADWQPPTGSSQLSSFSLKAASKKKLSLDHPKRLAYRAGLWNDLFFTEPTFKEKPWNLSEPEVGWEKISLSPPEIPGRPRFVETPKSTNQQQNRQTHFAPGQSGARELERANISDYIKARYSPGRRRRRRRFCPLSLVGEPGTDPGTAIVCQHTQIKLWRV